jgi:hypothetical protein
MSLFNTITAEVEQMNEGVVDAPTESTTPETVEAKWWLDANTPGNGDRPAWLPEKYKSAEEVAKAYKELESRLGRAPAEYDFSKGESWMEFDYEPFKEMADYAKSKHVPQDVMDKMLETVGMYLDEFKQDYAEEKARLGENADERLRVLNNWASTNLSEKAYKSLTANMRTAEAIEALEEIRIKMLENTVRVPTGNEDLNTSPITLASVQQELHENFEKYKSDPLYREQLSKKFEIAAARAGS